MIMSRGSLSVRVVGLHPPQKIMRKIALNIWINVFVRRYVHFLKEYESMDFKFNYVWWSLKSCGSYSRLYPTQALHADFSTTRPNSRLHPSQALHAGFSTTRPNSRLHPTQALHADFSTTRPNSRLHPTQALHAGFSTTRPNSRLHPTQALHAGFSTARTSGGRISQLGQQAGCSSQSDSRRTLCICLLLLMCQMLEFW
jgi:hypothetical protein